MIIETATGPVRGRTRDDGPGADPVVFFGGVPYARAGRFEAPSPTSWSAELDCTQSSPAPPQVAAEPQLMPGLEPPSTAEGHLTVDVWTPDVTGSRPVVVWIPGGAFLTGGSSLPTYHGARLALDADVVVVSVNYRVGLLGFLPEPSVPTNLGLRDLHAALEWVRRSVAAFGGDPGNVTAMGESAGAGAIYHLITGPVEVDRAIVASGSPSMTLTPKHAARVADTVVAIASLDELRTAPVARVLEVQEQARNELLMTVGMMPFHPWVDHDVVPATPIAAASGSGPTVDMVIGTTADEMRLFRSDVAGLPDDLSFAVASARAAAVGITDEGRVRAGMDANDGDLPEVIADLNLHVPARLVADGQAGRGAQVYRYRFAWEAPGAGACHGLDLPFHFGTLDRCGWDDFAGATGARAVDAQRLGLAMRHAWGAFARGGPPACEPVGPWPAHRPGSDTLAVLDKNVEVRTDPRAGRMAAWLSAPGRPDRVASTARTPDG